MHLLYGHTEVVIDLLKQAIPGCGRGFGPCTALGVIDDDGLLLGGFVFYDWDPEAGVIQLSLGGIRPGWLTRKGIRACFAYPFDQLGCQLVVARVDPMDRTLRRLGKMLGCREHVIPRLRGRNRADVIMTLPEEAWRACALAPLAPLAPRALRTPNMGVESDGQEERAQAA